MNVRIGHISLPKATVGDEWEHQIIKHYVSLWNFQYDPSSNDVIIIGGGGLLYERKQPPILEDEWLKRVEKAKHVSAVSIGFYSTETEKGRQIYSKILSKCELIIVRDPLSKENVESLCNSPVYMYPPFAFALFPVMPQVEDYNYEYGVVAHFEVEDCSSKLAGYRNTLLIPFCPPCKKVVELGLPLILNPRVDLTVATTSLMMCRRIITSRLHGLILATVLKKPILPITELYKVRYWSSQLGLDTSVTELPSYDELNALHFKRADEVALQEIIAKAREGVHLLKTWLEGVAWQ